MKTRFAPSPTGFLHIGVLRTALFNYLLAKNQKGSFVLRLEDTDKERSKKIFEEDIINALLWLEINWDEGPYRQSERGEVYKKYLKKLIEEDKAYYCFCDKNKLEEKRKIQSDKGLILKYDGECSNIQKDKAEERVKRGESFVIRLRMPNEKIEVDDLIRGKVIFDTSLIGDFVIAKDFDNPLYNFSVVIDDFEMGITDIIRGEDILPSTPKQIILFKYLNAKIPRFGHLPMVLGNDRSKLSKRHGATAVSDYIKEGYLKEAIINFLVFLGWGPGDEREIFTIDELIKEFDIKKINKSGAIFNLEKLDYFNGFYIRKKPLQEITELCVPYLIEKEFITPFFENREMTPNLTGIMGREIKTSFIITKTKEKVDFSYLEKVVSLYKERMKKLSEITEFTDYFFKEPSFDINLLKWKDMEKEEISIVLSSLIDIISGINNWEIELIEKEIMLYAESYRKGDRGRVLWPLRASLTGKKSSAGPFEVLYVLGKDKTLERLKETILKLK